MTERLRIACIQNRASADLAETLAEIDRLLERALEAGAELLCLPEYATALELRGRALAVAPAPEETHPGLAALRERARAAGVWLLVGSVAVGDGRGRFRNRSLLLDPAGEVIARYDKVHMFDVDLPDGEVYRESDVAEPGERAVLAATPWGPLGMTVCYDLRFPQLYRALARAGAVLLAVPAAFTRTTGQAHWHTLLRARAIECGAFVIAPGQYGRHGDAETYGHSLIVDPWGTVLADAGEGPGVALAELDLARVEAARRAIPALRHDRGFAGP